MSSFFRKFKSVFRILVLILVILIAWGAQKIFNGKQSQTKIAKADVSCWVGGGTTSTTSTTSTTGDSGCVTGGTTDTTSTTDGGYTTVDSATTGTTGATTATTVNGGFTTVDSAI